MGTIKLLIARIGGPASLNQLTPVAVTAIFLARDHGVPTAKEAASSLGVARSNMLLLITHSWADAAALVLARRGQAFLGVKSLLVGQI